MGSTGYVLKDDTGAITVNFVTSATGFAVTGNLFYVDDTGAVVVQTLEVDGVGGVQVVHDINCNGSIFTDNAFNGGSLVIGSAIGFFGKQNITQQTGGAATAGALYTANEQGMLQRTYDAMRAYGLLS